MVILESQPQMGGMRKPGTQRRTDRKQTPIPRPANASISSGLSLSKVNEPMLHIRPGQLCAHLVANV
jgi:hypothetical protein